MSTKANSLNNGREKGSADMKVTCTSCGHDINLDHKVFQNYIGPVKCFACSAMLEIGTNDGLVYSIKPLENVEDLGNTASI